MGADRPRRVFLVASAGGHLAQLRQLVPAVPDDERVWVTFEHAGTDLGDDEVVFCHSPTTRNVPNLLRNLKLAVRLVVERAPDLIVSTGAGAALPFFVVGRALGVRTVFVEVYDRIDSRTMTGRLVLPFSDAFALQWPEQHEVYGAGEVIGPLYGGLDDAAADLTSLQPSARAGSRVFATVGTDHHEFDRLVGWADQLATGTDAAKVFVQHGTSRAPTDAEGARWLEADELHGRFSDADAVICHGGPSTILEAIAAVHHPIVVPRDPERGEHVDGHQMRFAAFLADRGAVTVVASVAELQTALDSVLSRGRHAPTALDAPAATIERLCDIFNALTASPRRRLGWFQRRRSTP